MKKIIYIVGTGRSGSTLLCKTLGSHENAFAISELQYLKIQYDKGSYCSCERPYSECPFWTKVIQSISANGVPSLKMDIDGPRNLRKLKTIYSKGKAENLLFKQEEVDNTMKAYRAVFDLSGKDVIIDSGKNVYRALTLSRFARQEGWDTRFIYIIRDGRSVVNSYMKKSGDMVLKDKTVSQNYPAEPFMKALWGWMKINIRNYRIFNTTMKGEYYFLRYEDLIAQPERTVRKLCEFAGMPFDEVMMQLDRKTHHLVAGATARVNAKRIKANPVDWSNISRFQMVLFHLFAGWFNKKVSSKQ